MFFGPEEGVTTRDAASAFATEVVEAANRLNTTKIKNEIANIVNLLVECRGSVPN
jgi:hypothetical protein